MSLIYKIYKILLDNKNFMNFSNCFNKKSNKLKWFIWLNILENSGFDFCEKMC